MMIKKVKTLILLTFLLSPIAEGYSVAPSAVSLNQINVDLMERSALVLQGVVQSTISRYEEAPKFLPAKRKMIVTDATIQIRNITKGSVDSSIVVVVPGGCIVADNICFKTDLFPSFKQGEEVVLFLNPAGQNKWSLADPIYGKQLIQGRTEEGQ